MKKNNFLLPLCLLLTSTNLYSEENLFGYWLTPGSVINIENCDNYICAKIETIFVDEGVDPKKILDDQNKDKNLRGRPIIGINVLSEFLIKDINQRTFKGGRIYDPRRGKTFKSNLYLNDDGSLRVEGCLAFICQSEDWKPLDIVINEDGTKNASLRNNNASIKSIER